MIKTMSPLKQNSKFLFLVFLLLTVITVVAFAQNINPADGLDENGMCNAFPDPVINPTDIIGKWFDRGTSMTAIFEVDGTTKWIYGKKYGEFSYKIDGDKLILKDGAVICKINYLDSNTLTLTDGGCDHPTYMFQKEQ